ncbi:MAG: methyltransferase family protein [Candidatus Hermodarchaeota archaeon]
MILLITLILLLVFILNLSFYWLLFSRAKARNFEPIGFFYKIFPIIWTITLLTIPILNSSLLRFYFSNNWSYFKDYWILFALLGILLIIIGVNFSKRGRKAYKDKLLDELGSELVTSGVFRIVRHPVYSGWVIIFFGTALISDSLICLVLCPIILIFLDIHAVIEEKLVLIPKYGSNYEKFKEKTPFRIIPTPLNFFLIIITIIIIYVGFLNVT